MPLDTLAYVKHLEAAGVDRKIAEAHAEALVKYVLPVLAPAQSLPPKRGWCWRALYWLADGYRLPIVLGVAAVLLNVWVWRH